MIGVNIIVWSLYNGISPMPTSIRVRKKLLKILPKEIQGTIYELGSGWGTLIVPLALQYPSSAIIGYETSPIPYIASKIWASVRDLKNLKIYKKNFLDTPLKSATLVICYLYPSAMEKLKTKFHKELVPGTWVVSHTFAIADWLPLSIYEVDDLYKTKIYVYRMPINPANDKVKLNKSINKFLQQGDSHGDDS